VTFSNVTKALLTPAAAHGMTFDSSRSPAVGAAEAQDGRLARPAGARAVQPVVIRFGRLGDMVMLTTLLQLLHQRFGGRCLVFAAGPWSKPLLDGHPDVEHVWSLPRHFPIALSPVSWQGLWALRRCDPGPIYVCEYQPRQVRRIRRLLRLGGINPARCVFITQDLAGADGHWVDRLARFAQLTPATVSAAQYPPLPLQGLPAPRLTVAADGRTQFVAWLNEKGWTGRELVLIQPGNFRTMSRSRERWAKDNADDKAWPVENWAALLRRLAAAMPEALLVLCGAPPEMPMLDEIRRTADCAQVVTAELPMQRLVALCSVSHSMISIDTGPAHAAAACGLPLVVLYGAEAPRDWVPRSPTGSAVVALGGPPRSTRVDQLSVDEVFVAWDTMTAGSGRRHSAASGEC
jgi:ADP-heptose:LPS heptosyltransferase